MEELNDEDAAELLAQLEVGNSEGASGATLEVSSSATVEATTPARVHDVDDADDDDDDINQPPVPDGYEGLALVARGSSEWVPDKLRPNCAICATKFGVKVRRHHCRLCGEVICKGCSGTRLQISDMPKPARICDGCVKSRSEDIMKMVTKGRAAIQTSQG